MDQILTISFPEIAKGEASKRANSLADLIEGCDRSVSVKHVKERVDSQDAGTILQIVLGAASLRLISSGIKVWLERNSGCNISITKGKIRIDHISSENAAAALHEIMK